MVNILLLFYVTNRNIPDYSGQQCNKQDDCYDSEGSSQGYCAASVAYRQGHNKSYNYMFTAPQLWWCFCSAHTHSQKVIPLHVHSPHNCGGASVVCRHSHEKSYNYMFTAPTSVVVLLQCADTVTKSHTITCSQPPQLWWCFCSVQAQSPKVIQLHVHSPHNCGGASVVCRHSHQKSYNYMFTAPTTVVVLL